MSKKILLSLVSVLILSIFSTLAIAQETITKTTTTTKKEIVQNPDGTWTVIEYPVNKEVVVQLTPSGTFKGNGNARIIRSADGTAVNLDLSGMPADMSKMYLYAVSPSGSASLLGPLDVVNGAANQSFSTPLNQFMLVLSPVENLTMFDDNAIGLRSALPAGYAVVPRAITSTDGAKQVATTEGVNSAYEVPMLNVPSFGNKTTEIRIHFKGQLAGLKGKAYIDKAKGGGARQIKMRFDDMKMAPKEKKLVLWASSADGKYVKLGQVINSGDRQESEIRSETSLADFGLFVTVEDTDVEQPTSTVYSVFGIGD